MSEQASAPPTDRPVVYLLAGLLCDESVWAHQIAALSGAYEVRARDFRAFDSIAAMAASVLDEAPARFSLAGHSLGARVALGVMQQALERVERLALLDAGVTPAGPNEPAQRQALVDLAKAEGMAALAARWLPPMVSAARHDDEALMAPLKAMVERMTPESFARQQRALLDRPDFAPTVSTIRCPTLVGVGDEDAWSPPAQHEAIAAAIPGARMVVFAKSGHMSPVEAPEAVTAALMAWMEEAA